MQSIDADFLAAGAKIARKNTWGSYTRAMPSVVRGENVIKYSTSLVSVDVDPFDEIVLYILMKCMFLPIWLVIKFYQWEINIAGMESTVLDMIHAWNDLGIVWVENHVTGQYLRPTYALFQMFNEKPAKYSIIPAALLTHTVSEEAIMFEVMAGYSDIVKRERVLPRISELGFEGSLNLNGTNIIHESDFRFPFVQSEYEKITQVEHDVQQAVALGSPNFTPELADFKYFSIVKRVGNTGQLKNDFVFHVPDMIIPLVRDNGKPLSIAIEVELSNKRAVNYEETMLRYKDNGKYGVVYWYCNGTVANQLRIAYDAVGGTGSCRMELVEFEPPTPEFWR